MSAFTPTGGSTSGSITVSGVNNPEIGYLDAVNSDTEYSYSVPSGTRIVKVRGAGLVGAAKLKMAFTVGDSGTLYISIFPGSKWESPLMEADAISVIYIQSTKAGERIELEFWK